MSVDRFGVFVFSISTLALLFSVYHFISNKQILGAENYPLFYDFNGVPSLVGSGLWFVLCPFTHLAMYLFFCVVNAPKTWFFPVQLNRDNANAQYNVLRHHILGIQLFVAAILIIGQVTSVRIVEGVVTGLPEHFVPFFVLLFFVQTVHYLVSAFTNA